MLCIFKTTFAFREIKFLIIQPIIPFARDSVDKIDSFKCIIKANCYIVFLVNFFYFSVVWFIFNFNVFGPNMKELPFFILNLNFHISFQRANLFRSVGIASFYINLTSSLKSLEINEKISGIIPFQWVLVRKWML